MTAATQTIAKTADQRATAAMRGQRGNIRNAKQSVSIQDTAAERWSRLYVDVRASYGRAAIQAALLLNGGPSVALLAFLGNLAIAQQTKGITGNFGTFKGASCALE